MHENLTGDEHFRNQPGKKGFRIPQWLQDKLLVIAAFAVLAVVLGVCGALLWIDISAMRAARDAKQAAFLSLAGPALADELRDTHYEVTGVVPGGSEEAYKIVFYSSGSNGTCLVEDDVIVSCDWFAGKGDR